MSLELQLSTRKAQRALANFERSLSSLDKRLTAVNKAMITSGTAARQFATNTQAASRGVKAAGNSAAKAAQGVSRYRTQTMQAAVSTRSLSSAGVGLKQVLAGMGIAVGAIAFGRLVRETYQLNNAMQRIKILFDNTSDGMKNGDRSMTFLRKTARETALQIDVLAQSWSTFGFNVIESGFHIDQAESMFKTLSSTMRVLNLSAEQSKRTFQGFQQIVTKGTFSMEEIKQQIGENVPALKALERAVGVSGNELQKMLAKGAVGIEHLMPLMEQFNQQYARLLPQAMETTAAAFDSFRNELTFLAQDFSKPIWDELAKPIRELGQAIKEELGGEGAKNAGEVVGKAIGQMVNGITGLIRSLDTVQQAWTNLSYVITAVVGVKVFAWLVSTSDKLVSFGQLTLMASRRWGQFIASIYMTRGAAAAAAAAFRPLWIALAPLAPYIAVVAAFAGAFVVLDQIFNDGALTAKLLGEAVVWVGEQFGYTRDEVAFFMNALRDLFDAQKWIDWMNWKVVELLKSWGLTDDQINVVVDTISNVLRVAWASTGGFILDMGQTIIDMFKAMYNMITSVARALGLMTKKANEATNAAQKAANASQQAPSAGMSREDAAAYVARKNAGNNMGALLPGIGSGTTLSIPGARGGGLSNKMGTRNPRSQVPASAFVGAPHFAQGGVTGGIGQGGIPSILHPNEAVIPLRNGAVPVSINSDNSVEGKLTQAINENREMRNALGDLRKGETIDFDTKGLDKFIQYAEMIAKNTRAQRAADWDANASATLNAFTKLREEKEYQGFSTSGGTMGGGNDKQFSINKGGDPTDMSGTANKYGQSVKLLQRSGGNLVTTLPGHMFSADYYKDIRPDFDFAGNTGMGWDIRPGLSMKHYKAGFGATKMGVPVSLLPGATPGDMQHRYQPENGNLNDRQQTRIGMAQMSQSAAASGLAMWQAMKKEGNGSWDSSIAASYAQGARDARNPPGMRKLRGASGSMSAIDRAVQAGKTLEEFMDSKGIEKKMRVVGGGYANNPAYAMYAKQWATASKKMERMADYVQSGSMGVGEMNVSDNVGESIIGAMEGSTNSRFGMTNKLNVGGLARGTANTSNDPAFRNAPSAGDGRGGRMVAIHPNEAVIPLKNGKVPIQLGTRAMGQSGNFRSDDTRQSSGGVTVNMTITASDVESFRRNEKQLMQDLSVEMQRASQEIGMPSGQDLTKIRNAPPKRY